MQLQFHVIPLIYSGKILSVHRHDWPSCFSTSCHSSSRAVVVIDSTGPSGHEENNVLTAHTVEIVEGLVHGEKEEDPFRPSYPTADIP